MKDPTLIKNRFVDQTESIFDVWMVFGWSLDDPWISFVINHHFDHELTPETYLDSEIRAGLSDGLNITSVSLLVCSFLPEQGSCAGLVLGLALAGPWHGPWPGPWLARFRPVPVHAGSSSNRFLVNRTWFPVPGLIPKFPDGRRK